MIQAASHCGIRHRGCVILIVDVDMPPTSNTNMCHIIGLLIYTRPCSVLNFLPFHLSFNPPFCCQLCLGDHFACLIYHLTHSCCLLAPTCVLARPSPSIQFNMPSSHNALLSRSLQPLYLFLVSFVAHFYLHVCVVFSSRFNLFYLNLLRFAPALFPFNPYYKSCYLSFLIIQSPPLRVYSPYHSCYSNINTYSVPYSLMVLYIH